MSCPANSVILAVGGLLYGVSLTAIGFLMTGGGHGTYLLLGLASAPLSFVGFSASLVAPPLLWCGVGALLARANRRLLICIMGSHYLGVLLIPFNENYADWKYFKRVWVANPMIIVVGFGLYLIGQIIIWYYSRNLRSA